ncbi:MAG: hypothetical protein GVY16_00835 [Planctomycetes bacterium]|jgi:hypothetical protein|nr:hypothetical protein [Planctomycetota bacterium]
MQELDIRQINEAIEAAVDKCIPLTLAIDSDGWKNLHSRFIDADEEHILVEPGISRDGVPQEFVPAERIALSFKLKHHKYLGSARVVGMRHWTLEDGAKLPALAICYPTHMQRVQRRAFSRVDVPDGKIVRVSFWLGGKDTEPTGSFSEFPVYSAKVTDISAGGFRAIINDADQLEIEPGDRVGVHIVFGPGEESVYADAQFRHCDEDTGPARNRLGLAFQFLGLPHTPEGRDVLKLIAQKVSEFGRTQANSRHREFHRRRTRQ